VRVGYSDEHPKADSFIGSMCFTRSANPSGSAGSLGKGAVDEFIGDRGSTDGANCVGSVVVLDSENPRGEDVLAGGGDAACLVDQLLGTAHAIRLTLE
jgi:hypothetical protein